MNPIRGISDEHDLGAKLLDPWRKIRALDC